MRALRIDFAARRGASPAGWMLLVAGLVAAVLVLFAHRDASERVAAQEAALRDVERSLPRTASRALTAQETRARKASLAAAQRIEDKLNLPWGALFSTLESLADDDVALLSLAPDPRKQQLRLSAEARTLEAMLAFHRRLEGSDELGDVALVNHEIVENAPERPVRFDLTARWSIDRAHP